MRPIDADVLLKRRRNFGKDYALDPVDKNIDDQLVDLRDVLNAPTLDYAPVRHGEWISDAQHYIKNLGAVQYGLQQLEKWDYYIKQRGVCPENSKEEERSCLTCKYQGADGRGVCMDCDYDYRKWRGVCEENSK